MSKLGTYTRISLLDLVRLWRSTQHHVIIVAGICLPLLLLLGIKSGFIDEMREELLASPQGREITFWAMASDQFLRADNLGKLEQDIKDISLLIPEIQRLVRLSNANSEEIFDVTLVPTTPDDPLLRFAGVDLPEPGERQIVLTKTLAEKLNAEVGSYVTIQVARKTDAGRESHAIELVLVTSIYDSGDNAGDIGYCDIGLIDEIELYVQGFAADTLELPAADIQYSPKPSGYLLVARSGLDQDSDLVPLADFGLRVVKVDENLQGDYPDVPFNSIQLYLSNMFDQEKISELVFYYVDSGNPDSRLGIPPAQIASKTRSDDVLIALFEPLIISHENGDSVRLIGMDVSRSTWLRNFTVRKGMLFRFPNKVSRFRSLNNDNANHTHFISIQLGSDNLNSLVLENVADDQLQRFVDAKSNPVDMDLFELQMARSQVLSDLNGIESDLRSLQDEIEMLQKKLESLENSSSDKTRDANKDLDDVDSKSHDTNIENVEALRLEIAQKNDELELLAESQLNSRTIRDSLETEYSTRMKRKQDAPIYRIVDKKASDEEEPVTSLVVPTRLLGCLHEYVKENIQFDQDLQIFTESTPVLTYGRARIYCSSIDTVPMVVQELSDQGYAVLSEKDRIDEIHATDSSLQLLVVIVGVGVIGFGILTVFSVLSDSTDRKRGTIGVLRVMGVSRRGVFYVVVLRAALIGVAAGGFSICCGVAISTALQGSISISFEFQHFLTVILGALFCSGAGALFPALKASRLDPFDAIQEGKFH